MVFENADAKHRLILRYTVYNYEVAMSHPRPYYKTITLEEGCN